LKELNPELHQELRREFTQFAESFLEMAEQKLQKKQSILDEIET
jgi:hypothetical protein